MREVRFYSFINNVGNQSYLVSCGANYKLRDKVGFMIFHVFVNDYKIVYFDYSTPIKYTDTLLSVSLIDFIEILKNSGVQNEVISEAVKQIEEWDL